MPLHNEQKASNEHVMKCLGKKKYNKYLNVLSSALKWHSIEFHKVNPKSKDVKSIFNVLF